MKEMTNLINEYITPDNKGPYSSWLDILKDKVGKARIISQVDRMELGIFGDSEPVGEGVSELRIHYGPGYRVYYAKEGKNIYLLFYAVEISRVRKEILNWQSNIGMIIKKR